jgi:uncharacterized protein (DUF2336 family)
MLAISARPKIGAAVTDVLLQRGDRNVLHKLAGNSGASFSERGFETLVQNAERDQQLAEKVGLRLDIPLRLFRELLLRATEAVRSRLLAVAAPESRDNIQRVLAEISENAQHQAAVLNEYDYAEAHARLLVLQSRGEFKETHLLEFAKKDRHADVIAGLSLLCEAPMTLVDSLLQSDHREAWLIPCKSAGLDWPTVRAILTCRSVGRPMSDQTLDSAKIDYTKLTKNSAGRVLRFWQVRQTVSKAVPVANPLRR